MCIRDSAGSAKLSTEQRSKITTIFRQNKVEPAHLNISVSVGTRVPDSVHFYPLPVEVIVVYPEWRGYDYILVGNEILVICLLYTSDAADDLTRVDLGGR